MGQSECDRLLERVCGQGCDVVRRLIADLEAGREVDELADVHPDVRRRLLAELKAIMAVYDGPR